MFVSFGLAWKILWSYSGYRGWDDRFYREWVLGRFKGFGYVEEHGFGHEWWNFYESFSKEYYYGYAPPVHAVRPRRFMDGGVIFFVSKPLRPVMKQWFLVGVYGRASVLDEPEIKPVLWDYVDEEYRSKLSRVTVEALKGIRSIPKVNTPTYFVLKADKQYSTPLPEPMPLELQDDLGIPRMGQAFYFYLNKDRALGLLEKAKVFTQSLGNNYSRQYWINPVEALNRIDRLIEYLKNLETETHYVQKTYRKVKTKTRVEKKTSHTLIPERVIEYKILENPEIIEEGLRIIGNQITVGNAGRIDVLAEDKNGTPVIIEIKVGKAGEETLTQLMAYISEYAKIHGVKPRGYIVAEEIPRRLRKAVEAIKDIEIVEIKADLNISRKKE